MPIFDFKCEACGYSKDLLRKISDPMLTECPECHRKTFTKQVSPPSFQLTGSGWYVTDFKNQSKDARKTETKTETKKDESASSTSS
jgi:putative FmdB family regulatory protein